MQELRSRLICSACKSLRDITEFPLSRGYRRSTCSFCKFRRDQKKRTNPQRAAPEPAKQAPPKPAEQAVPEPTRQAAPEPTQQAAPKPAQHIASDPEPVALQRPCTSCLQLHITCFQTCGVCRTRNKATLRRRQERIREETRQEREEEEKSRTDAEISEHLQGWEEVAGEDYPWDRHRRPLNTIDYREKVEEPALKKIWLQKQERRQLRREAVNREIQEIRERALLSGTVFNEKRLRRSLLRDSKLT